MTDAATITSLEPAPAAASASTPLESAGSPDQIPPAPSTDPEHGDLTPDFVRWFLHYHSVDDSRAKYGTRADKLPADCVLE